MKSKVVVFGGAGFLGSHIADCLSDANYDVTIFDRNKSQWLRNDQKMIVGDIRDEDALNDCLQGAKYVYHLAAVADIGQASKKPLTTIEFNIVGSAKIIEAAIKAGVDKFMFASSIYVYSQQGSFYRVTKQATELLIEAYQEQFGLNYTILRYGSLYGPRAQEWNGIKRFIIKALNENPFVHAGTGEEQREYIHVKDAARLSVDALDDKYSNSALILTGIQTLTSKQLLTMINEILGGKFQLEFAPEKRDPVHYAVTPYRFTPRMADKMVPEVFIDIGQGILEIIEEVYFEMNKT